MRVSSDADRKHCPACGGEGGRGTAKFCADCGKLLTEEYEPLDAMRASYRMQRTNLANVETMDKTSVLFENGDSILTQTAWACVVYSMVPYLGVLFLPFALITSAFGYVAPSVRARAKNRRLAAIYLGISTVLVFVQAILWSLLYLIPDLMQRGNVPN